MATTHIKRQFISGDNSYQFEKATTHQVSNRLQILVFNFKKNLRINAIKNSSLFIIISPFRHSTHHNYILHNHLNEGVIRK